MTDREIIAGLHNLSIKLNNEMRFAEAEFVDQAMARIMDLPRHLTRMEHPSVDRQVEDLAQWVVDQYKANPDA